eukprot:CFRG5899T1
MVKEFTISHVFDHPWANVTQATWQKYPNDHSPHVKTVDIVDRNVSPTGTLDSIRLIGCQQQVPYLLRKLVGSNDDEAYVYESSKVDLNKKKMVLVSRNVTFCNLVTVDETCTYTPNPIDENTTLFEQKVAITAVGVPRWVVGSVESALADNYQKTAAGGRNALDEVCDMVLMSPFTAIEHMAKTATDDFVELTTRATERVLSVFDWDDADPNKNKKKK